MAGLSGRGALVTGGGRGIGRRVALDLAAAGARVMVASRSREDTLRVTGEIEAEGGTAFAAEVDVTQPESVAALFEAARRDLGAVDVLVAGAGIAPSAPLVRTSDQDWRLAIETNLSGVFYCLREALPAMTEKGWGRAVAIASIAGKTGGPYMSAYAASKHGVLGLTKCAALEVATRGVTVNAVCPGFVDTPMTDVSVRRIVEKTGLTEGAARARLADASPQKRIYTVEEVSALVLFLCGTAAGGINGQALNVDGGTVL